MELAETFYSQKSSNTLILHFESLGDNGELVHQQQMLDDYIKSNIKLVNLTGLKLGDCIGHYVLRGFKQPNNSPFVIEQPEVTFKKEPFSCNSYSVLSNITDKQLKILKLRLL
jgi:hypothetical protein